MQLKRVLSDTKAELSRCKLQVEASAQRRKQFSNKALQILMGKDKDGNEIDKKASSVSGGDKDKANDEIGDKGSLVSTEWGAEGYTAKPPSVRQRAKSWCFDSASVSTAGTSNEAMNMCQRDQSKDGGKGATREMGVQTDETPRKRDVLIPRPSRSRSNDLLGKQEIAKNLPSPHMYVSAAAETPTHSNTKCMVQKQKRREKEVFYFDSAASICSLASTANETTPTMAMMTAAENESSCSDNYDHCDIQPTGSNVSHLTGAFSETETVTETESSTFLLSDTSECSVEGDNAVHDRKQQWREHKQRILKTQQSGGDSSFATADESINHKIPAEGSIVVGIQKDVRSSSKNSSKTIGRIVLTTALACVLSAVFAYCIFSNSSRFGIRIVGGELFVSSSRTIVAGLGLVALLWWTTMWTVVGNFLPV